MNHILHYVNGPDGGFEKDEGDEILCQKCLDEAIGYCALQVGESIKRDATDDPCEWCGESGQLN